MMILRPGKRYLASANPPRLASETAIAVCAEARKMELISHRPKLCCEKRRTKLDAVRWLTRIPRSDQGSSRYRNRSLSDLTDAHTSQMNGARLTAAAMK